MAAAERADRTPQAPPGPRQAARWPPPSFARTSQAAAPPGRSRNAVSDGLADRPVRNGGEHWIGLRGRCRERSRTGLRSRRNRRAMTSPDLSPRNRSHGQPAAWPADPAPWIGQCVIQCGKHRPAARQGAAAAASGIGRTAKAGSSPAPQISAAGLRARLAGRSKARRNQCRARGLGTRTGQHHIRLFTDLSRAGCSACERRTDVAECAQLCRRKPSRRRRHAFGCCPERSLVAPASAILEIGASRPRSHWPVKAPETRLPRRSGTGSRSTAKPMADKEPPSAVRWQGARHWRMP